MKPLLLIAWVLLGAAGFVQVMPDGDRLAQRPRRINPRGGPAPTAVPQPVGTGDAPRSNDPMRCIAACDNDMRGCLGRCPRDSRSCDRVCFTANARCYSTCPGDAATIALDGGWHRDAAPDGPVWRTLPRR